MDTSTVARLVVHLVGSTVELLVGKSVVSKAGDLVELRGKLKAELME